MKLTKQDIKVINNSIIDGINQIYDLIDNVFNLSDQVDDAVKNDLVPLVVNAVLDLIERGKLSDKTISSALNKIYDRLDAQYNLNDILDFSFKSVLIPVLSAFIASKLNKIT